MHKTLLRPRPDRAENGQVIVFLVVVLAVIGGGWWFLKSNRDMREREAWEFAREAGRRIVLQQDSRFLDFSLTNQAQITYPPSWRFRLMNLVREPGTPNPEFKITKGEMFFTNHFFEPRGNFIAEFQFPTGPAYLELHVSHPGALWVIDDLNWTWQPVTPTPAPVAPPPPAPGTAPLPAQVTTPPPAAPTPVASVSPAASPSP